MALDSMYYIKLLSALFSAGRSAAAQGIGTSRRSWGDAAAEKLCGEPELRGMSVSGRLYCVECILHSNAFQA